MLLRQCLVTPRTSYHPTHLAGMHHDGWAVASADPWVVEHHHLVKNVPHSHGTMGGQMLSFLVC